MSGVSEMVAAVAMPTVVVAQYADRLGVRRCDEIFRTRLKSLLLDIGSQRSM